jgi:hypothetical protein
MRGRRAAGVRKEYLHTQARQLKKGMHHTRMAEHFTQHIC